MSTTLRLGTGTEDLERAAQLLVRGGLVAVPTETVYGLAVRADDADAVARLFAAKGRPADNPLIVHVADVAAVATVAREVPPLARTLLARFAPGPLTVVLPARDDLPRAVTGGLDTVAVRIPDHPVALALLRMTGLPLAAPSANRSGRPSPTRAEHVLDDLAGRIDAVIDAGPTRVGVESTVVDARGPSWTVLRAGGVGPEDIAAALGERAAGPAAGGPAAGGRAAGEPAIAPGTRHRHYAPALPVHVAAPGEGLLRAREVRARLGSTGAGGAGGAGGPATVGLVVMRAAGRSAPDGSGGDAAGGGVEVLAVAADAAALAADLFALLREAERRGLDALVVEGVPAVGVGAAVMDRLARAAEASGGTSP